MAKKDNVQPIEFPYSLVKKNPFGFPQWESEAHKRWAFEIERGFERGVQEIARRMLKYQFEHEFISWTTGLTDSELEQIDPSIELTPKIYRGSIHSFSTKTETVCEVMYEWNHETKSESEENEEDERKDE